MPLSDVLSFKRMDQIDRDIIEHQLTASSWGDLTTIQGKLFESVFFYLLDTRTESSPFPNLDRRENTRHAWCWCIILSLISLVHRTLHERFIDLHSPGDGVTAGREIRGINYL